MKRILVLAFLLSTIAHQATAATKVAQHSSENSISQLYLNSTGRPRFLKIIEHAERADVQPMDAFTGAAAADPGFRDLSPAEARSFMQLDLTYPVGSSQMIFTNRPTARYFFLADLKEGRIGSGHACGPWDDGGLRTDGSNPPRPVPSWLYRPQSHTLYHQGFIYETRRSFICKTDLQSGAQVEIDQASWSMMYAAGDRNLTYHVDDNDQPFIVDIDTGKKVWQSEIQTERDQLFVSNELPPLILLGTKANPRIRQLMNGATFQKYPSFTLRPRESASLTMAFAYRGQLYTLLIGDTAKQVMNLMSGRRYRLATNIDWYNWDRLGITDLDGQPAWVFRLQNGEVNVIGALTGKILARFHPFRGNNRYTFSPIVKLKGKAHMAFFRNDGKVHRMELWKL